MCFDDAFSRNFQMINHKIKKLGGLKLVSICSLQLAYISKKRYSRDLIVPFIVNQLFSYSRSTFDGLIYLIELAFFILSDNFLIFEKIEKLIENLFQSKYTFFDYLKCFCLRKFIL
ncbi:hypothetical protein BpHYR1_012682 [Brachionus plicatilis]|uniref:Uncharacterized protein n=1 Tax=Brachionus plicatilis TaxID=10195 RepID=A0A3M7RQ75_BRAPC|nr:hypothetical protein BpHYR1_012682 [Brachionus plicatilis]